MSDKPITPHQKNEATIALWTKVVGAFTVVLAVTTIINSWIAYCQWQDLQDEKRPQVVTENVLLNIRQTSGIADTYEFALFIKNSGESPAFIRRLDVEGYLGTDLPAKPSLDHNFPRIFIISPATTITTPNAQFQISDEDKKEILNDAKHFYVYGSIEYTDAHGKLHKSGFAYRLYPGFDGHPDFFSPIGSQEYWIYN